MAILGKSLTVKTLWNGGIVVFVVYANHSIVKSPVPTAQSELAGVSI